MLKIFEGKNFNLIYDLLKQSFPISEIRSFNGQKQLLKDSRYKIYCRYCEETLVGVICAWHFEGFIFLEHFAVAPEYRNNGIGFSMIKSLLSNSKELAFLEAEPPQTQLQKRRVNFYERCGFFINDYEYCQPAFSKYLPAVPLKIMSYGKSLSFEEFSQIKNLIYKEVYHQKV